MGGDFAGLLPGHAEAGVLDDLAGDRRRDLPKVVVELFRVMEMVRHEDERRNLKAPEAWRRNITHAMSEILGEQNLEERLAEIYEMIKRMDFYGIRASLLTKTIILRSA